MVHCQHEVITLNTVFYGVVEEEKERNLDRQKIYREKIKSLPQGYLVVRKRGNKTYYYLQQRDGETMKTKHLKVGTDIDEVKYQIAERKHYEGLIKRLQKEYKQMCKVVKDK